MAFGRSDGMVVSAHAGTGATGYEARLGTRRQRLTSAGMSDRLSPEVVAHVAQLARLDLTPEELVLYTGQLAAVLEHAADVAALDLGDVPPTYHPLPLVNVLRDDEPRPGLERDEVLAMAPDAEDWRFRVPRIMSEES